MNQEGFRSFLQEKQLSEEMWWNTNEEGSDGTNPLAVPTSPGSEIESFIGSAKKKEREQNATKDRREARIHRLRA
jgi:hypothetical protein